MPLMPTTLCSGGMPFMPATPCSEGNVDRISFIYPLQDSIAGRSMPLQAWWGEARFHPSDRWPLPIELQWASEDTESWGECQVSESSLFLQLLVASGGPQVGDGMSLHWVIFFVMCWWHLVSFLDCGPLLVCCPCMMYVPLLGESLSFVHRGPCILCMGLYSYMCLYWHIGLHWFIGLPLCMVYFGKWTLFVAQLTFGRYFVAGMWVYVSIHLLPRGAANIGPRPKFTCFQWLAIGMLETKVTFCFGQPVHIFSDCVCQNVDTSHLHESSWHCSWLLSPRVESWILMTLFPAVESLSWVMNPHNTVPGCWVLELSHESS